MSTKKVGYPETKVCEKFMKNGSCRHTADPNAPVPQMVCLCEVDNYRRVLNQIRKNKLEAV